MADDEKSTKQVIQLAEICRVEGHAAVDVTIDNGKIESVKLNVFEGTRFFERIVLGHKYDEMPHITSRVCAICSTGHVLAAIFAIERAFGFEPCHRELLYRELMHLGMIIESHATHICALALPDFLKTPDILDFATKHPVEFDTWTQLRKLGAAIQTTIGGRPFHPVNLHVGRLSSYPGSDKLTPILTSLNNHREMAISLANVVLSLKPPMDKTTETSYLALVPRGDHYGYFGSEVKSTDGWHCSINEYKEYLSEVVVPYSHAKKSSSRGQTFMVGAMARLALFGDRLGEDARAIYQKSPLAAGSKNTVLNNLAQAIELVEAIQRAIRITETLINLDNADKMVEDVTGEHSDFCHQPPFVARAGESAGAVECPRGTLYHYYKIDDKGTITSADMVTPSAQNTARIEADIRVVVEEQMGKVSENELTSNLETLVRAYDPCNTCATHMVQVKFK